MKPRIARVFVPDRGWQWACCSVAVVDGRLLYAYGRGIEIATAYAFWLAHAHSMAFPGLPRKVTS